jgi:uncharacterized membrane protein
MLVRWATQSGGARWARATRTRNRYVLEVAGIDEGRFKVRLAAAGLGGIDVRAASIARRIWVGLLGLLT